MVIQYLALDLVSLTTISTVLRYFFIRSLFRISYHVTTFILLWKVAARIYNYNRSISDITNHAC
ncbi:hypothetical protein L211DRAFT_840843 [Terfezia boudieri ATCC MYA-4762]|uniref:Uncharacterized protein n=1 Tax=Terfezia boudieri ATCC MYA-4762 TaxID=1051890 RepID=A0A3N4LEC9_9PEZI|nr:hypothetical protein L211DRAFT_840843 [Terfezia boudieri ATCC MYA-4762]